MKHALSRDIQIMMSWLKSQHLGFSCILMTNQMEKDDKGSTMIRMGVSG